MLSVGILTYAIFSALAAFADTWWQLGMLRFIAGLGSGVEAPVGAALIAETWRNRFRARAGGIMMSGYAFGFFAAAAAYALLGDHGWRCMLALAGLPALLVWFIRRYVPEPPEITAHLEARRERKRPRHQVAHDRFALRRLIEPRCGDRCSSARHSPPVRSSPSGASPRGTPRSSARSPRRSSCRAGSPTTGWPRPPCCSTPAASSATPPGVRSPTPIGRRKAFLLSFAVSAVAVAWTFPFDRSYTEYLIALPFLGFGLFGALSGTFIYAPELFPPSVRATALAVCNSVGRYVTALVRSPPGPSPPRGSTATSAWPPRR